MKRFVIKTIALTAVAYGIYTVLLLIPLWFPTFPALPRLPVLDPLQALDKSGLLQPETSHRLHEFTSEQEDRRRSSKTAEIFDQEIHFDEQGLIVHVNRRGKRNGGDTAQREGWYWLGVWIRANVPGLEPWPHKRERTFEEVLNLLEPKHDGVFVRHPTDPEWNDPYRKDNGTSRDQLEPLVAAMGVWGQHERIRRLWHALPVSVLGKHAFNGKFTLKNKDVDLTKLDVLKLLPECKEPTDESLCGQKTSCTDEFKQKDCSLKEAGGCQLDVKKCKKTIKRKPCSFCPEREEPNPDYPKCMEKNARRVKEHQECVAKWAAENARRRREYDLCQTDNVQRRMEAQRRKVTCQAQELVECQAKRYLMAEYCANTYAHSGDLILPSTVNLFRRAMEEDPLSQHSKLDMPAVPVLTRSLLRELGSRAQIGDLGEHDLYVQAKLRGICGKLDATDTSDDLNLIVKLLIGRLPHLHPTDRSLAAGAVYGTERPHTYGSYFDTYIDHYGEDWTDLEERMAEGVSIRGWKPSTMAHVGAVRWYHRPSKGANPRLAELYRPILEWAFPGSVDKTPLVGTGGTRKDVCKVRVDKDE
ncbi:MAG: hypothetical protein ABUT39_03505 [Acidobacteriota bacterium]